MELAIVRYSQDNLRVVTNDMEQDDIRNVWRYNLHQEFSRIRVLVQHHSLVAIHCNFLGTADQSRKKIHATARSQRYQLLRSDVNQLQMIQLGLSLMDADRSCASWQFNFKFNEQSCAQDLKEEFLLKRLLVEGVDPMEFAALLMTSGIVLMDNVKFLSYDSSYDFAYLVKLLTNTELPPKETEFAELLSLNFPVLFDIKTLMKNLKPSFKLDLHEFAEQLGVRVVGSNSEGEAGRQAHLTGRVFLKVKQVYFNNGIDYKYSRQLFGLDTCLLSLPWTTVKL